MKLFYWLSIVYDYLIHGLLIAPVTSKMEPLVAITDVFQPLTIATKSSVLGGVGILDPILITDLQIFETTNLNWKEIYILPRKVYIATNLRMFQYKILNNILFLNNLLSLLKTFHHHCVLFGSVRMKRRYISSILIILRSDYGTNFNILFLSIFIFLNTLHRVPSLDYLISAIRNRIFY